MILNCIYGYGSRLEVCLFITFLNSLFIWLYACISVGIFFTFFWHTLQIFFFIICVREYNVLYVCMNDIFDLILTLFWQMCLTFVMGFLFSFVKCFTLSSLTALSIIFWKLKNFYIHLKLYMNSCKIHSHLIVYLKTF